MIKKVLTLLICLVCLLPLNLLGWKCLPIQREKNVSEGLKNSDFVFLGVLMDSSSSGYRYTFKVLEIFKGNFNGKVIKGNCYNSCSLNPQDKGLWLVYANFQKDSIIDISLCGPSVSLKNPDRFTYPFPLISGKVSETDLLKQEIVSLNKKIDGLSSWHTDLYELKAYELAHTIAVKPKKDYSFLILLFSLIFNLIMFLMIIRLKKTKSLTNSIPFNSLN